MKIAIRGFLGEIPRIEAHRLPDINAVTAWNTKLFRANAEPFRAVTTVATLAKAGEKKAIYRFGQDLDSDTQYWFHWLNDTDVARGPTTGSDTEERTYYTEEGQPPRMTDATLATGGAAMPVNSYLLGLPAPGVTPTVSLADPFALFGTTSGVNATDDIITTNAAHGFSDTAPVTYSKQGGSAAIGLTDGAVYYVNSLSDTMLSLHTTVDDALNDTNRIALTADGAETHRLTRGAFGTATSTVVGYTYVNSWGHEGPMSLVSAPLNYYSGQTVNVSNLETGPAGNYNVTLKRVYIGQSDINGRTVLRLWKDNVATATTTASGTVDFTTLGAAAQEPEPIAPPADMIGLCAHPNGFMLGIRRSTKRLHRSEVFKPYAWPDEYSDPLDDVPVAICVIGQSVVIGTRGPTYLASGNDPLSMIPIRLEGKQPCVSKRSMKLTNRGVIYASPDGLVAVTPDGRMDLVTRDVFTRDQWQAYKPESMHAVVHDERYFCFWQVNSGSRGLLIFDFTGEGLGVIRSDQWASAAYADPRRDTLFLAMPSLGDNLGAWDLGVTFLQPARPMSAIGG